MLLDPFPKSLVDLNTLFVTIVVPSVILDLIALSFKLLKESKEKRNLSFLEVVLRKLNWIWLKVVCCWSMWLMLLPSCLCASSVLIIPTLVSLLMRHLFQKIITFGWGKVPMVDLCSFGPWSNSFNLCRTLHALDASLSCICASCISLYALFFFFWSYFNALFFSVSKIQKPIKSIKSKKFNHLCCVYHFLSLP